MKECAAKGVALFFEEDCEEKLKDLEIVQKIERNKVEVQDVKVQDVGGLESLPRRNWAQVELPENLLSEELFCTSADTIVVLAGLHDK